MSSGHIMYIQNTFYEVAVTTWAASYFYLGQPY